MKTLVIGGTGYLGGQIAREVKKAGHELFALVRPGSNAAALEELGAELRRGDLTDEASLDRALEGMDAVVASAIGYTGRRSGDSLASVDGLGNRNLARAARRAGIQRLIFISVLSADRARSVAHFFQKFEIENYLEELGVPFVALRPGGFLDQNLNQSRALIEQGVLPTIFREGSRLSMVLSEDVARAAAAALTRDDVLGKRVELGFEKPSSFEEIARELSHLMGRAVSVKLFKPPLEGMDEFVSYVESGQYVATNAEQAALFGRPRTLSEAVASWALSRGSAAP